MMQGRLGLKISSKRSPIRLFKGKGSTNGSLRTTTGIVGKEETGVVCPIFGVEVINFKLFFHLLLNLSI